MSKCDTCEHNKKVFIFLGKKYCEIGCLWHGLPLAQSCMLYDHKLERIKK